MRKIVQPARHDRSWEKSLFSQKPQLSHVLGYSGPQWSGAEAGEAHERAGTQGPCVTRETDALLGGCR